MSPENKNVPLILIADDNAWMQRIIAKILLSYGLRPAFASNGYEAVSRALEMQPRAIFLDIVMPDISGHQTLRMLKSIAMTREIPVLIITVESDSENLSTAIKLGASGFVRKPFTRATIYDKLVEVIGENLLSSLNHEEVVKISDADLDAMMNMPSAYANVYSQSALSGRHAKTVAMSPDAGRTAMLVHNNKSSDSPMRGLSSPDDSSQLPDMNVVKELLDRTVNSDR